MTKAYQDEETSEYFHPGCVPEGDKEGMVEVDLEGFVCKGCNDLIAEDNPDPASVNPDDEDEEED